MQTFHIDLSTKNVAPVLHAKQGDVGRKFRAVITDNGTVYDIPADARFSLWFSGPGGEGNYSAIGERSAFAIEGNTVIVELIAQMLTNAGTGALCLVLFSGDGDQLGLWNLIYTVEHVPGLGSKAAEDYYTALSELAQQAIHAAETFETDPTLSAAGKAADAAAVGIGLAGKAPAGYGLGEDISGEINLDTVTKSGNYKGEIDLGQMIGTATVWCKADMSSPDCGAMTAYGEVMGGVSLHRTKSNGVWGQWEWIDPPMKPGVEYRTTARWDGKAVYTKLIDFGPLPNATTKTVSANTKCTAVIHAYGYTNNPTERNYMPLSGQRIRLWASVSETGTSISIATEKDMSAFQITYVAMQYTRDEGGNT